MAILVESEDKEFIEALNELLFGRGINSAVIALGYNREGQAVYGVQAPDLLQEREAYRLLFRDTQFITDLGNARHAGKLFEIRAEHLGGIGSLLTSKPALWLMAGALLVLAIDLVLKQLS
ncbi:MAG: hypothetical protein K0S46_1888 [Moraxellaceae bacterium]|nr:hypothetical protein [Moraxellaceae bacterium]